MNEKELKAFCVCCWMPTPKKASARQEAVYQTQRRKMEIKLLHRIY